MISLFLRGCNNQFATDVIIVLKTNFNPISELNGPGWGLESTVRGGAMIWMNRYLQR